MNRDEIGDVAKTIRAMSGVYDQASRRPAHVGVAPCNIVDILFI